jgi:anti-sigma regulatory factor (Ser/Thr protein kinase)
MMSRQASNETLRDAVAPSAPEHLSTGLKLLTGDDGTPTFVLEPEPESVTEARHFVLSLLRDWGLAALRDDIGLVVSELVTNALRHSLPPCPGMPLGSIRLRLLHENGTVLCGVIDSGMDVPVRREPDFIAETGRGLHIVESFSAEWGWTPVPGTGKIVWALFRA